MSDGVALQTLFADVCRTLAGAGFDVTSARAEEGVGLRVRQESDAVTVSWVPAQELDPARRVDAEYAGIRAALRQALLETLTQAGFQVKADPSKGEVRVRPAP
ncbi:hypothetical protein GCM10018785_28910 [Streptomyces longispororuber]|uniref:Uncharacterized protein n=1 Tax=Streptomyces longispororuber TaxID=68230 RepID=A0A919DLU0_9ACTN|nr:hypothetical protein [Streptomyces longispororuber]GHE57960.1 hypothetical protein GCM10018785_28910 [Streptomyces longispororuber]